MEVRTDLADHEARPGVGATVLCKAFLEQAEELVEDRHVGQAAVHFFRADFVGNGSEPPLFAEILDMGDQFDRPCGDHFDVDDFAFGQEAVHGRIDVDQFVAGQQRRLIGALDPFHRLLVRPHFEGLDIFEPGSAMVDAGQERSGVVVAGGFHLHHADEVFLGHAGIAAVAVNLVERGGKQDRRIVAFGGAEGRLDDCWRVRADGKEGHRLMTRRFQFPDTVQQSSQFGSLIYVRSGTHLHT